MSGKILLGFGILVLFAVLAISMVSASEYYLLADNSGASPCNMSEVQLRINATQPIQAGKVTILHNPSVCANITGISFDPEWESKTMARYPDRFVVTFSNEDEYGIPTNLSAGDYCIGTLTIHCDSTSSCKTDLIFNTTGYKTDLCALGVPHIPFAVDNGTFTCEVGTHNINVTPEEEPVSPDTAAHTASQGRTGGGAQPTPTPTPTPSPASTLTPTLTPTPQVTPALSPSVAAPTSSPSSTPIPILTPPVSVPVKRRFIIVAIVAAVVIILAAYLALRRRT